MVQVYFATNRQKDATAPSGFGAKIVANDPPAVTYAVAEVERTMLADESSGQIVRIDDMTPGGWSNKAIAAILAAGKNLLVFIHGFDNSFEDAIKRAAYNADWFRASGVAAADTTMLAFTWPSEGKLIAAPPHFPSDAYFTDQAQAGRSSFHLGYFLDNIDQLRIAYKQKNPSGRIFLLAHSMGNHALQAAVQWWFQSRSSKDIMFDETILAAADEVDDSFEAHAGARLSNLPYLTNRISIYYSRKDVAMYLSACFNLDARLGYDGPAHKHDTDRYRPGKFRIIDCTEVSDFALINPPDATHQYYRRSKIVRGDIVAVLSGGGSVGLGRL
ncbi:MAG TPA: alpha/beta hydrolase [Stellaceae bacterium]|nr:alpha/beta hydrolase [Stellaceae bacterium]